VLSRPAERAVVASLLVPVTVAYLALVPRVWQLTPDSALYMGLARSLAEGEGYTFNFAPHAMVPPGFPLMLAGVRLTVGQNIWAMQALVAVCGVGALLAVYGLVKARAGFWPALAIVLLTATNRWFVENSSRPLSDMPYTFLSLALLWCAERELRSARFSVTGWSVAAALGIAAIYTSFRGVVLVPAVLFGVIFARWHSQRRRHRWVVAGLLGLVWTGAVLLWVARGWALPSQASYAGYHLAHARTARYIRDAVCLRMREWAAAPFGIDGWHLWPGLAAGLLALGIVPGLVKGVRAFRGCAEAYLCAYFVLFAFIIGPDPSGKPHPDMRYSVPVVPLLFYYGYLTLSTLAEWAGRTRRAPRLYRSLPVFAGSAVFIWGIAALAWWGFFIRPHVLRGKARSVASLEEAGQWAQCHIAPSDRICTEFARIAHVFTRRQAVELRLRSEERWGAFECVTQCRSEFLLVTRRPSPIRDDWRLRRVPADYPGKFSLRFSNELLSIYHVDAQSVVDELGSGGAGAGDNHR